MILETVVLAVQMRTNIDKKAVGRRIRQIRVDKEYSQIEFGKLVGAGKSSISNWENGVELPTGERLLKLLDVTNISLNELFYGSSEKDIQNLYEQIIKLPKDDVKTLLTNVVNHLKKENNEN